MRISFSRVANGAKSVPIRIALAQINPRLGDLSANLARYEERISQAAKIDAYFDLFPDADARRRGNKMARERMSILYDHSAR